MIEPGPTQLLEVAVPLWVMQFQEEEWEYLKEKIREAQDTLEMTGEAFSFRIPEKSAKAFNAVAKALAVLSFCPGGVTFGPYHFENQWRGWNPNEKPKDEEVEK